MRLMLLNFGYEDDAMMERAIAGADVTVDMRRATPGVPQTLAPADIAEVDGLITYSPNAPIWAPPDAWPRCRIVLRSGVGFDNVDIAAWGKRGVPVCNVPDYGTTEVADHAIALMLSFARGTATYHAALRRDPKAGWRFADAPLVRRLRGATIGIVGLGRIGLAAALRAQAFGMRVHFYDPYLPNGSDLSVGFTRVRMLEDLMALSDVVSVHAPLSEETRGMMGAKAFAAAKPGLILINTARGPMVDLDALATAIRKGQIGGAGLDVLPAEPADANHPLISAWMRGEAWLEGRLTLSPHAAFYSPASIEDMRRKSVETVLDYLREGHLANCVNAALLERKA